MHVKKISLTKHVNMLSKAETWKKFQNAQSKGSSHTLLNKQILSSNIFKLDRYHANGSTDTCGPSQYDILFKAFNPFLIQFASYDFALALQKSSKVHGFVPRSCASINNLYGKKKRLVLISKAAAMTH